MDGRDPKIILDWSTSVWRRYAIGRSLMGAEGTAYSEKIDSTLNKPAGMDLTIAGA